MNNDSYWQYIAAREYLLTKMAISLKKRIVIFVSFYFSRQIARKNAVETDTKIRLKSGSKSGIDFEKI